MVKQITLGILALLLFSACNADEDQLERKVKHVILIGSDGLGAYAFDKATGKLVEYPIEALE